MVGQKENAVIDWCDDDDDDDDDDFLHAMTTVALRLLIVDALKRTWHWYWPASAVVTVGTYSEWL